MRKQSFVILVGFFSMLMWLTGCSSATFTTVEGYDASNDAELTFQKDGALKDGGPDTEPNHCDPYSCKNGCECDSGTCGNGGEMMCGSTNCGPVIQDASTGITCIGSANKVYRCAPAAAPDFMPACTFVYKNSMGQNWYCCR